MNTRINTLPLWFRPRASGAPSGATAQDLYQAMRLLVVYRAFIPLLQVANLVVLSQTFEAPLLTSSPVLALLLVETLLAAATLVRLRIGPQVQAGELWLQACIDIGLLTALLYFTGGGNNPLTPYFVLPVMIVAMALPSPRVWLTAILTLAAGATLRLADLPTQRAQDVWQAHELLDRVLAVNFFVTAAMLVYFCNRLAASLRRQAQLARRAQEAQMRSESVAAIGALAAGSAHELGSPLSTVAVIAAELLRERPDDARLRGDLLLIETQVQACKQILDKMARAGGERCAETACGARLDEFISATIERVQTLNPGATIQARLDPATPAPLIVAEETVRQAIANLIQNAVHASPQHVHVAADWSGPELVVSVVDRGPGFSPDALQTLGKRILPGQRSRRGLGMGLLLSAETLQRLGGALDFSNRKGGGACVQLRLPLAALVVDNVNIETANTR